MGFAMPRIVSEILLSITSQSHTLKQGWKIITKKLKQKSPNYLPGTNDGHWST